MEPTQEQIRNVRRYGFARAIAHMPEARGKKLVDSYAKQDGRREANITKLVSTVTGRNG